MNYRSKSITASLLLAFLLAFLISRDSKSQPRPVSTVEPALSTQWEPAEFGPLGSAVLALGRPTEAALSNADFSAQAKAKGFLGRVDINWRHLPSGARLTEVIQVGYFPTAVCRGFNPDEIFVAGKFAGGATLIERWTLQAPGVLEVSEIGTINTYTQLSKKGLGMILAILHVQEEGKDVVTAMVPVVGSSSDLLAKFSDGAAVYRIGATTRPAVISLVAKAVPDPGVLSDPSLTGFHSLILPMRVLSANPGGRVGYYFTNAATRGPGCLLEENELTGVIDQATGIYSGADWGATAYSDGSQRIPL